MSYYDYKVGQEIAAQDYSFYALIQAAMRRADTDNALKLRAEWPEIWLELLERHDAPGGKLSGDDTLLRQCEVCGGDATIPCLSTTVEGVKTEHLYCDKHYPFGVAVTIKLRDDTPDDREQHYNERAEKMP